MSLMSFGAYQRMARRTQNPGLTSEDKRNHALFGLASEAGEVCSIFQKQLQGHDVDISALTKEIGDVLWMLAELCDVYGLNMGDVAAENIRKLEARYPEGFSAERSVHREEDA